MRKGTMKLCLALLILICLLAASAGAETVRGDLSERFSDVPTIEYGGESYRMRNRITTVLALGIGSNRADVAFLLVVDDDEKSFKVMEIEPGTLVQVAGEAEGETWNMRFADVYRTGADSDDGARRMLQALNGLLGEELVENYLAFDVEGVKVVDESLAQGTTKEQLKALVARVEELSSDELNDLYKQLSDYIITDMKSGAVMKVIDKMDRYERPPRTDLPGAESVASDGGTVLVPDAEEILKYKVDTFYEVDTWQ